MQPLSSFVFVSLFALSLAAVRTTVQALSAAPTDLARWRAALAFVLGHHQWEVEEKEEGEGDWFGEGHRGNDEEGSGEKPAAANQRSPTQHETASSAGNRADTSPAKKPTRSGSFWGGMVPGGSDGPPPPKPSTPAAAAAAATAADSAAAAAAALPQVAGTGHYALWVRAWTYSLAYDKEHGFGSTLINM